jgi:hypothetical protein
MNVKLFLAAAMSVALSAGAASAEIGINFYPGDTTYPNQLAPTSLAGVAAVAQTNWNNMTISNGDGNGHWNGGQVSGTLTDDTGSVFPALTVTAGGEAYMNYTVGGSRSSSQVWYTDGNGGQWGWTGNGEVIQNGSLRPSPYIDISGIPYSEYNVFVYISAEGGNGGGGTITISDMSGGAGVVDPVAADGVYTYPWSPNVYKLNGNYIQFTGNTSNSIEVHQSSVSWNTGIAAIQIDDGIPEPASLALLALGALLVLPGRKTVRI